MKVGGLWAKASFLTQLTFHLSFFVWCQPGYGGNSMRVEDIFHDPKMLALVRAAERVDSGKVQELARSGVDLNAFGNEGMTPLMWVLGQKNKKAMKILLTAGADPNRKDPEGDSPISMAAGAKDDEFLKILLDAGGNPNATNRNGEPLLNIAVGEFRLRNIDLLLDHGANINITDRTGATPLLAAATLNQYDLAYHLIERGAYIYIAKTTGATLAWRVQQSRVNPASPQYQWLQKVKKLLEERGIKFPVPHPSNT